MSMQFSVVPAETDFIKNWKLCLNCAVCAGTERAAEQNSSQSRPCVCMLGSPFEIGSRRVYYVHHRGQCSLCRSPACSNKLLFWRGTDRYKCKYVAMYGTMQWKQTTFRSIVFSWSTMEGYCKENFVLIEWYSSLMFVPCSVRVPAFSEFDSNSQLCNYFESLISLPKGNFRAIAVVVAPFVEYLSEFGLLYRVLIH